MSIRRSKFGFNPKWGFGIVFGIAILIFVARGILSSNFKYEIQEPDYSRHNNTGTTSHFCNNYTEEGNCISFIDEFGTKNKICGAYKIINNK